MSPIYDIVRSHRTPYNADPIRTPRFPFISQEPYSSKPFVYRSFISPVLYHSVPGLLHVMELLRSHISPYGSIHLLQEKGSSPTSPNLRANFSSCAVDFRVDAVVLSSDQLLTPHHHRRIRAPAD